MNYMNIFKKFIWFISHHTPNFRGKKRLVNFLTRTKKAKEIIISRQNVNWNIYGKDIIEFNIAASYHDLNVINSLTNQISKKNINIFWDVGANIGSTSLPIAKKFPNLKLKLFEPSPAVMGTLIQNLTINTELIKQCNLYCIALSNQNNLDKLFTSNEVFNSGVGGLGLSSNREKFGVYLNTYTGDYLIKEFGLEIPQIIKIDVEGFEIEVLEGLKETIKKYKPIILFEHSLKRLKVRDRAKEEVFVFLKFFGYKFYETHNNQQIFESNLNKNLDIIALTK